MRYPAQLGVGIIGTAAGTVQDGLDIYATDSAFFDATQIPDQSSGAFVRVAGARGLQFIGQAQFHCSVDPVSNPE